MKRTLHQPEIRGIQLCYKTDDHRYWQQDSQEHLEGFD